MSSKAPNTTSKKRAQKKAVRQVPSRYMQAAQASKSSRESTSVNTTVSLHSNETLDVGQATWIQQSENLGSQFSSTPNSSDDCLNVPLPDASLIVGNTAHSAPVLKRHLIPASALKQMPKSELDSGRPSRAPVPVTVSKPGKEKSTGAKGKISGPDRVQEIEVKNMYAMYVQAAFLESRARKSFQMRTKNALEQFYKVYCVIQILMQKLASTESVLLVVNHLELIEKLLKPQEDILEVISKEMPELLECYSEISKAIDFVRSNLPLSDVHVIPDSNLRADLSCQLAKCEAQLESFFKNHSSEITEPSNLSKLLLQTQDLVKDLQKDTHQLNDLLLAVDEMAITESSLKVGEILSTAPKI